VIAPRQAENPAQLASGDREAHFVAFVLDDAQQFWATELPRETKAPYRHAKLVLFTDSTRTACGLGDAATGPFYCPGDEQVYIDLGFFQVLSDRLGAHGEFARGYVVAHEIGHHVQKILGVETGKSHAKGATGGSVRLELQADCFAGIWARSANDRKLLEPGDLESALDAASRIGDDVLQQQSGHVRPESFTHGTAKQRYTWLKKGYDTGSVAACDTFSAPAL
jgi:predicted metalloprotease